MNLLSKEWLLLLTSLVLSSGRGEDAASSQEVTWSAVSIAVHCESGTLQRAQHCEVGNGVSTPDRDGSTPLIPIAECLV